MKEIGNGSFLVMGTIERGGMNYLSRVNKILMFTSRYIRHFFVLDMKRYFFFNLFP